MSILEKLGLSRSDLRPSSPKFGNGIVVFEGGVFLGEISLEDLGWDSPLRRLDGKNGAVVSTGVYIIREGRVRSSISIDELSDLTTQRVAQPSLADELPDPPVTELSDPLPAPTA